MQYFLGVDLGGTKVAIGLVDEKGTIHKTREVPTIKEPEELATVIAQESHKLLEECAIPFSKVTSMGIGVPGTVDKTKRIIVYANNLDFVMVPFVELLEKHISIPIKMENDANVAAWAEYRAGVGKGQKLESFVLITLGTGVGAGLIIHDQLFSGCNQGAGEIGHMVIDQHGILCSCGRRGCFESYASTTALLEQAREAMSRHVNSSLWQQCDGNPEKLNGKQFFESVRKNDTTAIKVLTQFVDYLSVGVLNMINIFQPDYVVIGGGISNAGDLLLEPLRKIVKEKVYTKDDPVQTKIEVAKLGNEAGIIGAALL